MHIYQWARSLILISTVSVSLQFPVPGRYLGTWCNYFPLKCLLKYSFTTFCAADSEGCSPESPDTSQYNSCFVSPLMMQLRPSLDSSSISKSSLGMSSLLIWVSCVDLEMRMWLLSLRTSSWSSLFSWMSQSLTESLKEWLHTLACEFSCGANTQFLSAILLATPTICSTLTTLEVSS